MCAVTWSCSDKWHRCALILTPVSDSGEEYFWSWGNFWRAPSCGKSKLASTGGFSVFLLGVFCLFFFSCSFFPMLSCSSYLVVMLIIMMLIIMVHRWDLELCFICWERGASSDFSWQPDFWHHCPFLLCTAWTEMTPQLTQLLTVKHWWTGSLNHSCWVGVPVTTKPGNSCGLSLHQLVAVLEDGYVELKIDLPAQSNTWWITRSSWSHLM